MIGKGCNIDDTDKLYRTRTTRMLQIRTDLSVLIRTNQRYRCAIEENTNYTDVTDENGFIGFNPYNQYYQCPIYWIEHRRRGCYG